MKEAGSIAEKIKVLPHVTAEGYDGFVLTVTDAGRTIGKFFIRIEEMTIHSDHEKSTIKINGEPLSK